MASKREMVAEFKSLRDSHVCDGCGPSLDYGADGEVQHSEYLGSYMSLDPCGRYHHLLSPNGATARCERYWERLEEAGSAAGGWIESGEGDPTDIFFSWS